MIRFNSLPLPMSIAVAHKTIHLGLEDVLCDKYVFLSTDPNTLTTSTARWNESSRMGGSGYEQR